MLSTRTSEMEQQLTALAESRDTTAAQVETLAASIDEYRRRIQELEAQIE